MSTEVFNNNVTTTLSARINSSQTTITVTSATGIPALSAGQFFRAVLTPSSVPGSAFEYLTVTAVAGTTLTVTRGAEGSTALSWNTGDIFYMTATAASYTSFAAGGVSGVSSFNTRTGAVTLTSGDVTTALGFTPAGLVSPAFTSIPTAPTASVGTNTAQLATCAFVIANAGGGSSGVSSFNTRTGAVTLSSSDVTGALTYTPANINGSNATGTWPISISGTAATATTANALNTSNSYTGSSFTANNGMTINLGSASSALEIATGGVHMTAATAVNGYGIQWGSSAAANFASAGNFQVNCITRPINLVGTSDGSYCLYGFNGATVAAGLTPAGSWTALSDGDLKSNKTDIVYGLQDILKLSPVSYTLDPETESRAELELAPITRIGLIAQEVELVIPEAVSKLGDHYGLDYMTLVPVLIQAVKDLNKKVTDLEGQVIALGVK